MAVSRRRRKHSRGEQNFLLNPAPCLMHFRLNTVSETPFTVSICTAALRMQKSGTVHVLNLLTTGRFIIYRLNTGKFGADDAECLGKSARSSASLSPQSAAFKTMFSSRMPTVAPASTTKMMPYPLPPINESAFRTVQSLRSAIGTTRNEAVINPQDLL